MPSLLSPSASSVFVFAVSLSAEEEVDGGKKFDLECPPVDGGGKVEMQMEKKKLKTGRGANKLESSTGLSLAAIGIIKGCRLQKV